MLSENGTSGVVGSPEVRPSPTPDSPPRTGRGRENHSSCLCFSYPETLLPSPSSYPVRSVLVGSSHRPRGWEMHPVLYRSWSVNTRGHGTPVATVTPAKTRLIGVRRRTGTVRPRGRVGNERLGTRRVTFRVGPQELRPRGRGPGGPMPV